MEKIFFTATQIGGFLSSKKSREKMEAMFEMVFSFIENIRINEILLGDVFMGNALFMCKALCGLGFLYHIYQNGYSNLLNLELKSFFKLWQPIAIFVGIAMYDTLILFLEHLLFKINLFITHSFEDETAKLGTIQLKSAQKETNAGIFGISLKLIGEFLYNFILDLVVLIGFFARFWILLKRAFFLFILTITGVISLTLSIFPPFSDSFNAWLQKYVGIWLWLPMVGVIDWILLSLNQKIASGGTSSDHLIGLVFAFFSIIAYMMIPEFTNWIVSGSSSAVSQFNRNALSMTKTGGKVAGGLKKGGSLLMKNPKMRAAAQALKIIKKS